jgi:transcriptional regulator with XRE-family HTH domain
MNYVKNNLKFLRKKEALTQEQLATKIGVKRAMIGAYEEGRAEPRLHTLQHLAAYFQVRLDDFVNKDLSGSGSIPKADVSGAQLRILPVIVDGTEEKELGTLVTVKASAGYLSGYGDADYIGALPRFSMPFPELPQDRTYRVFKFAVRVCCLSNRVLMSLQNIYRIGSPFAMTNVTYSLLKMKV